MPFGRPRKPARDSNFVSNSRDFGAFLWCPFVVLQEQVLELRAHESCIPEPSSRFLENRYPLLLNVAFLSEGLCIRAANEFPQWKVRLDDCDATGR